MSKEVTRPPVTDADAIPTPAYRATMDASGDLDLFQLVSELWGRKWIIIATTSIFAVIGVAYALLAEERFRSSAVLAPKQQESQASLPSGIGGLASLAGIRIGASGDNAQAVAVLRSRALIEDFINAENLMPVLFADDWNSESESWINPDPEEQPDLRDGVKFFDENVRSIDENVESGLITLTVEWTDADVAARWVDQLVRLTNDKLRDWDLTESRARLSFLDEQLKTENLLELRQTLSRMIEEQMQTIMLAQADTEYAFRTIDPPRAPIERSSPRRKLVVALAVVLGGFLGLILALFKFAADNRRSTAS